MQGERGRRERKEGEKRRFIRTACKLPVFANSSSERSNGCAHLYALNKHFERTGEPYTMFKGEDLSKRIIQIYDIRYKISMNINDIVYLTMF